jgi:acetyltransferase-like isoleucine patch superfamily enzyme
MTALQELRKLWRDCRSVRSALGPVIIRHIYFRIRGKKLITSNRVTIYGLKNITTGGLLRIGLNYVGLVDHHDRTLLRIGGKMRVAGPFSIGRGCRLDIGKDASVSLESGVINSNTSLIIMHGLEIGADCGIGWGCQFLDEDFHTISYSGSRGLTGANITIGDHVWIASRVTVLKGSVIPNGSVVASGSVVISQFSEENTLIAGNPARVARRNISWRW